MKPIRDISELSSGAVVYHSAFGFARIVTVESDRAEVDWEASADSLPRHVPIDVLKRLYARCEPGGFFEQSAADPEAMAERLQTHSLDVLCDLLADLDGPQRPADVRDWIVGRGLMTDESFRRWWRTLAPILKADPRFDNSDDTLVRRKRPESHDQNASLADPMLSPSRRLDLALESRSMLGEEAFLDHVVVAWRTGNPQIQDRVLEAVRGHPPGQLLERILSGGRGTNTALVHALRSAGWRPQDVPNHLRAAMVDRIIVGVHEGGRLDSEGLLAAALHRWSPQPVTNVLSDLVRSPDGKRLVRATFSAMPQRRGEELALSLLDETLASSDRASAQWVGGELLGILLVDARGAAERLDEPYPALADWFRHEYIAVGDRRAHASWDDTNDDTNDDTAYTAEVEMSGLGDQPTPLSQLPPRSGTSLLGLGLGLARALAAHHKDGTVVNPTTSTVRLLPDETLEADLDGRPNTLPGEEPSTARDVYAGALVLLEVLFGRPWPRTVAAHRALPYLRTAINLLPPSAIGPLDAALHVDPALRPASGLEWVALWQAAAVAEEDRSYGGTSATVRARIGYDSHIGRVKVLSTQTNQDAVFVSTRSALSLVVVCDGISTANAGSGDLASSIATHVIANLWEHALPRLLGGSSSDRRDFLDHALRAANTAVCEAAMRIAGGDLAGRVPMGTTIVTALLQGNQVTLAWLGDSRAYLVGSYGASLLTADENQAGERLRAWHLGFLGTWEPVGFALVGYLGHFNELLQAEALPAHHIAFEILPGEHLVLCSDGVTDYVADTGPEVARLIAETALLDDPDEIARTLVAHANRGGGGDNASAVVTSLL
jgi:protein phosphatase